MYKEFFLLFFKCFVQFIQRNKTYMNLCNIDENGQPKNTSLETVGCVYNRYRLVHRWVPEMVLNVQSDF